MIAFGPVPSRRLGKSLGVNNIPRKVCTYDCVYCQIGKTELLSVDRRNFFKVDRIIKEVSKRAKSSKFDYITFVPDGEPTLDINLEEEIKALKDLGKIAVITNASLLWIEEVREALYQADWVSVKIDAATKETWKKIDRPHPSLSFDRVIEGIRKFSEGFNGISVSETMLVSNYNDSEDELEEIASLLKDLNLSKAYISTPTRPPAYDVKPASDDALDRAYMLISSRGIDVEILSRPEVGFFDIGDDPKKGILSITAVHPMRETDLVRALKEKGYDFSVVEKLLSEKRLEVLEYRGVKFYRKR